MSGGPIEHLQGVVDEWQEDWRIKYRSQWRILSDGKYYPREMIKCGRKDLDELDIATVR